MRPSVDRPNYLSLPSVPHYNNDDVSLRAYRQGVSASISHSRSNGCFKKLKCALLTVYSNYLSILTVCPQCTENGTVVSMWVKRQNACHIFMPWSHASIIYKFANINKIQCMCRSQPLFTSWKLVANFRSSGGYTRASAKVIRKNCLSLSTIRHKY